MKASATYIVVRGNASHYDFALLIRYHKKKRIFLRLLQHILITTSVAAGGNAMLSTYQDQDVELSVQVPAAFCGVTTPAIGTFRPSPRRFFHDITRFEN